ncbi:DUF6412 domain-containing protein [Streptomyces sp. TRM 70361]|uniref:DUF6412 domain-containing protein n=1 Tax=Streptomyces sp. TRM 70361 TaxID=3116553 RepID=UPI002E7B7F2E|nr:DUF6412 domain-containing protein [Streptomyces sp. TRM 70361]MEE1940236.1 DUF6412 domain-containing protein [Streptomyces sp. TRM 70361]
MPYGGSTGRAPSLRRWRPGTGPNLPLLLVPPAVLALLALLTGLQPGQGGLATTAVALAATAAAGTALAVAALLAARLARPAPPARVRTALRDRERRTAFLPQRDPDAAGRPRPRAPGRPLPTAG